PVLKTDELGNQVSEATGIVAAHPAVAGPGLDNLHRTSPLYPSPSAKPNGRKSATRRALSDDFCRDVAELTFLDHDETKRGGVGLARLSKLRVRRLGGPGFGFPRREHESCSVSNPLAVEIAHDVSGNVAHALRADPSGKKADIR